MSVFVQQLSPLPAPRLHPSLMPHWLMHLGALGLFSVSVVDSSVIPWPMDAGSSACGLELSRGGRIRCFACSWIYWPPEFVMGYGRFAGCARSRPQRNLRKCLLHRCSTMQGCSIPEPALNMIDTRYGFRVSLFLLSSISTVESFLLSFT
jgi:hypothetical protein